MASASDSQLVVKKRQLSPSHHHDGTPPKLFKSDKEVILRKKIQDKKKNSP